MKKWIRLRKQKPPVDTPILVFRQGYDITGERYWSHTEIAEYIKPPYRKRFLFAVNLRRDKEGVVYEGFALDGVTHWMSLPSPPKRSIAYLTQEPS